MIQLQYIMIKIILQLYLDSPIPVDHDIVGRHPTIHRAAGNKQWPITFHAIHSSRAAVNRIRLWKGC
jgi:hypothetical protein